MKQQKEESHSSKPNKKRYHTYLRYSGLAFELFAIIGIGSWGGYKLDAYFHHKYPIGLISLMLISTGAAFYSLFKKLPKE